MGWVPCPSHDVLGIPPNKMGGGAVRIDAEPILAIAIARERPGLERALSGVSPAMQKEKSSSVWIEQQMVKPMLCSWDERELLATGKRHLRRIGKSEQHCLTAC